MNLELRRKALEVFGWTNMAECAHGLAGMPPAGTIISASAICLASPYTEPLAHAPAIESDSGVALTMLMGFCKARKWLFHLVMDPQGFMVKMFEDTKDSWIVFRSDYYSSTPAEAIARAIVEAGGKK